MISLRFKALLFVAVPLITGLVCITSSMIYGYDSMLIAGIAILVAAIIVVFGYPVVSEEIGDSEAAEGGLSSLVFDPAFIDSDLFYSVKDPLAQAALGKADSLQAFTDAYTAAEKDSDQQLDAVLKARFQQLKLRAQAALYKEERAREYFWRMIIGCYVIAFGGIFTLLLAPFIPFGDSGSEVRQDGRETNQSYLIKGCVLEPRRTGIPNLLFEDRELGQEFEKLAGEKSELDCSKGAQWLFNFGGEIVEECRPGGYCGYLEKDYLSLPDGIPKISHLHEEILDEEFCQALGNKNSRCLELVAKHQGYVQRLNELKVEVMESSPQYPSLITQQFTYTSAWARQYRLRLSLLESEIDMLEQKHAASTQALESAVGTSAAKQARSEFQKWDVELTKKRAEKNRLLIYTESFEKRVQELRNQISAVGFATGQVITGGLTVPYYFVLLALFGGVVNLARRVPEYHQLRLASNRDDEKEMDRREAREHLIFQVIQFLSAPLIAVFVYSLVIPEQYATTVVLGFVSGFASQPLLLFVRQAAERLVGEPKAAR